MKRRVPEVPVAFEDLVRAQFPGREAACRAAGQDPDERPEEPVVYVELRFVRSKGRFVPVADRAGTLNEPFDRLGRSCLAIYALDWDPFDSAEPPERVGWALAAPNPMYDPAEIVAFLTRRRRRAAKHEAPARKVES